MVFFSHLTGRCRPWLAGWPPALAGSGWLAALVAWPPWLAAAAGWLAGAWAGCRHRLWLGGIYWDAQVYI